MEDRKAAPSGPRSILLVEDSLVEAEVLRRTLAGGGYRVAVAHDGRQALAMVLAEPPDLVMSDIRMPVMNGYELCRAIKGNPDLVHIPVILLSVLSEPDDIIEAVNAGADGYTIKPYAEASLLGRINSLLSRPTRSRSRAVEALEVEYRGKVHRITGDPQQVLNLLLSVYENTLTQNRELRAIQSELSALNDSLAARTAQLQSTNTELESFIYAASHDLRAPLRAITGFSAMLTDEHGQSLDNEGQRLLSQIVLGAKHMGELIDGLLALSRSTRGEMRREAVDLSALAEGILAELARGEPGRQVAWEVEEGLVAEGDSRMLEVLMTNLLSNAWKYTAGTPRPLIRFYGEKQDGQRSYCVADNGAGFDMTYAGRLFQPFQRLHRQDQFPGLGIGLATVRRIVERHGGTIQARGKTGEGAVFCFSLAGKGL